MPELPDISICIVNWNGMATMPALLKSIEAHAGSLRVQVIVVDNASTDGSVETIARDFPSVVLVRNTDNAGFARANNQAAELATAPLLFFLNNDTLVRSGALQSLRDYLISNPGAVAVGPMLIDADGKPQRTACNLPTFAALMNNIHLLRWTDLFRRTYERCRRRDMNMEHPADVPQLAAAALLVRRDAFDRCERWDDGFRFGVEDVDFCARLGKFGAIHYCPCAKIDHFGRISSRANRNFIYRSYECGYARYIARHMGRPASMLYKLLVTLDMPIRIGLLVFQITICCLAWNRDKVSKKKDLIAASANFLISGLPRFWMA